MNIQSFNFELNSHKDINKILKRKIIEKQIQRFSRNIKSPRTISQTKRENEYKMKQNFYLLRFNCFVGKGKGRRNKEV